MGGRMGEGDKQLQVEVKSELPAERESEMDAW